MKLWVSRTAEECGCIAQDHAIAIPCMHTTLSTPEEGALYIRKEQKKGVKKERLQEANEMKVFLFGRYACFHYVKFSFDDNKQK